MYSDYPEEFHARLSLLGNIRVVLVDVKFAGNVGMAARAVKNNGLGGLHLVRPRAEFNKEAYARALSGSDILDTAAIHDNLYDALADCGLVIGTTRRRGTLRKNVLSPFQAADMVREVVPVNKIAVVFGSEESGLSNDDLALCHWLVSISTGTDFESFNLAHSVAIIGYLLNRAVAGKPKGQRKLASTENLELMFEDIQDYLLDIGFIQEKDPRRMMMAIRKILHRSGLVERDVRIIRGILRQSRWRIANPDADTAPEQAWTDDDGDEGENEDF
ncbi:MAG: RNA methyltransferase [bacterium]